MSESGQLQALEASFATDLYSQHLQGACEVCVFLQEEVQEYG